MYYLGGALLVLLFEFAVFAIGVYWTLDTMRTLDPNLYADFMCVIKARRNRKRR